MANRRENKELEVYEEADWLIGQLVNWLTGLKSSFNEIVESEKVAFTNF